MTSDPEAAEAAAMIDPRRGGAFLFASVPATEVTTPEDLNEDARAVAMAAETFVEREVRPSLAALEGHDIETLRSLLTRMGALDLLAAEVPAEYGGLGLSRTAVSLTTEHMAPAGGFSIAWGAHASLAMLPLSLFGTDDQKARYLPRLARGEWIGAYALTEPGFGSDALNARTTARPTPDGSGYVLSGEKQWITNGGIADLFTVFAQLEGAGFTAFLVERSWPGVATGTEYEKMGLWSSSTRPLVLEDVCVPRENLLGEAGRGHVVALGVLDLNRLHLAAGCLGSSKRLIEIAARYALGRIQFGQPIARYGLIQEKLAEMQVRTFTLDAAVYRTAGALERAAEAIGIADEAKAAAEYAVECAILKVLGSETLGYIVDEAVQIHGGNGYMRQYEVERAYRDARIQRIFEGTNEINRLTVPETLARRAARGQIPVAALAQAGRRDIAQLRRPSFFDRPLEAERWRVEALRKAAAMILGLAFERLGPALADEEEVLGAAADIAIALYAGESALIRAERRRGAGAGDADAYADLAALSVGTAVDTARAAATRILCRVEGGDGRALALATLDRLTRFPPEDTIGLRRRVAARVLAGAEA